MFRGNFRCYLMYIFVFLFLRCCGSCGRVLEDYFFAEEPSFVKNAAGQVMEAWQAKVVFWEIEILFFLFLKLTTSCHQRKRLELLLLRIDGDLDYLRFKFDCGYGLREKGRICGSHHEVLYLKPACYLFSCRIWQCRSLRVEDPNSPKVIYRTFLKCAKDIVVAHNLLLLSMENIIEGINRSGAWTVELKFLGYCWLMRKTRLIVFSMSIYFAFHSTLLFLFTCFFVSHMVSLCLVE